MLHNAIYGFITWAMLIFGVYLIVTYIFKIPKKSFSKVIFSFKPHKKDTPVKNIDLFITSLSKLILPLVRLSQLKQLETRHALELVGAKESPEEYYAYSITLSLIVFLFSIPLFGIFPFLSVAAWGLAIFIYLDRTRYLKKVGIKSKASIESELPRFTSYISNAMITNSDAIQLLKRYNTDSELFRKEIDTTLADIRTSNFRDALTRLDNRLHSDNMTKVINGLIGIYNGDNVQFYFKMLERDFTTFEKNKLKKEVQKIPNKMQPVMLLMTSAIIFIFITPFIILLIENYKIVFGGSM